MSIRSNKSSPNLSKATVDDFETEFLLPSEAAKSASTSVTMRSSQGSTVLDMGLDYWSNKSSRSSKISYTVGNSKIHFQRPIFMAVIVIALALLLLGMVAFFKSGKRSSNISHSHHDHDHIPTFNFLSNSYNTTYPLTKPKTMSPGVTQFRIALVADLDTDSKVKDKANTWRSIYKRGLFTWDSTMSKATIEWTEESEIKGTMAMGGRGLELSELVTFDGHLLTVDDRTGIVYKIHDEPEKSLRLSPWVVMADGAGEETKGFKAEWATVKDRHLYVGGLGKEWTTPEGQLVNFNPMYIKRISPSGRVEHINWHDEYVNFRKAAGIEFPGYMIHEAIVWSDVHEQWFSLPRRASKNKYNEVDDEMRGTNFLLRAAPAFGDHPESVQVSKIGDLDPELATRGFSTFKFVPGTQDSIIVAIKSEEYKGKTASYIMVFHISGTIIYPETKIGDHKFEGIEFV